MTEYLERIGTAFENCNEGNDPAHNECAVYNSHADEFEVIRHV